MSGSFRHVTFYPGDQIDSSECFSVQTVVDEISEEDENFRIDILAVIGPPMDDLVLINDISLEIVIQDGTG